MRLYESFLKGIARLFDPFCQLDDHEQFTTDQEADYYALLSDWAAVGSDIEYAIEEYRALDESEDGT